jgi:superfamily II DNA/RNA helicase
MSAFEELGVMPSIIEALNGRDWLLPRPVQTEAIPLILGGGDVAVAAETGAGKTGAFCVPILQTVFETMYTPAITTDPSAEVTVPLGMSLVNRSREVALDGHNTIASGWRVAGRAGNAGSGQRKVVLCRATRR